MRQYIDSDSLAAEVRLQRTQDPRVVMLVEGATDARFFETFVDHEHCYVLSSHDRERALALLRVLNAESFTGVVAVVDADFGRITGLIESDSNLFFCDGHDLEMMLLRSPALERVVSEHGSCEKLESFYSTRNPPIVLAAFLAQSCMPIGAILLTSLKRDLALTFDGLSFSDFFDKATLKCDLNLLVRSVMNKSNRHDPNLFDDLCQSVTGELRAHSDPWEMSRGHDCVELLALALRSAIGTKKSRTDERRPQSVSADMLERELRLAFSDADFRNTQLASAIVQWESVHPKYRVLLQD